MKLTIGVVTMNRASQLREALESCLACDLPDETEFVIIDNASTDNTEEVVAEALGACGFGYIYEKLPENLGVGGGRNYAFEKSVGEYVYVLDDDAVIDTEKNPDFFTKAIAILEQNKDIVTLTTQIYDTAWKANRVEKSGPEIAEGINLCKMFCGGSHFLRRDFFEKAPYLANKYGYEEILPSLQVMDAGKQNVFCPQLMVIHKPAVNKWNWNDEKNHVLLVDDIALRYGIKKMAYPIICIPLLWAAAQIRFYQTLRKIPNARKLFRRQVCKLCAEYPIENRIKLSTVWKMVKAFKLSAF